MTYVSFFFWLFYTEWTRGPFSLIIVLGYAEVQRSTDKSKVAKMTHYLLKERRLA